MASHNNETKPASRDLSQELIKTVGAEGQVAPLVLSNLRQFAPSFTGLNTQLFGQAMQGQLGNAQSILPGATSAVSGAENQYIQSNPILAAILSQGSMAAQRGGSLSPEEQIAVDEQTNSGFAGTGMNGSMGNILARILNRGQYSQNRLQQNMGIASNAVGTLNGATAGIKNLAGGYLNPGFAINNVSNSTQLFNPESPYAQDLYNTNYNAQMSAYNSQQNNRAGLFGGLIGGGAQLGSGWMLASALA